MTLIDHIKTTIGSELDMLNRCMTDNLATSNKMMNDIVANYLQAKGKQIRPILVILSAKLLGEANAATIAGAAAIEMLHNASLIHDDVVDDTLQRRSCPTINAVWDNHVAVLVGDYFVSTSLHVALATADLRVIDTISRLGRTLSLGEIKQIDKARTHNLDEESYFHIIADKTASLFEACVNVGGFTTGAAEEPLARLRRYARLFGLCFQIRDDIFDYFADTTAVGKPTGNDLREGKVTLPLLFALGRTELPQCQEMRELVCRDQLTTAEINRLIDYAHRAGGIDYAYERMALLRAEAISMLETFNPGPIRDIFTNLFDYIIARKH